MFTERYLRNNMATSKMKPFVALFIGFQSSTNVTKISISVVVGVLDLPQEHFTLF